MFGRVVLLLVAAALAVTVAARRSSGAAPVERYVVRHTLWSIAAAHYAGDPREAIWSIERRNRLPGPSIQPGERLVLPSG